jgi:hypothetical protein
MQCNAALPGQMMWCSIAFLPNAIYTLTLRALCAHKAQCNRRCLYKLKTSWPFLNSHAAVILRVCCVFCSGAHLGHVFDDGEQVLWRNHRSVFS